MRMKIDGRPTTHPIRLTIDMDMEELVMVQAAIWSILYDKQLRDGREHNIVRKFWIELNRVGNFVIDPNGGTEELPE